MRQNFRESAVHHIMQQPLVYQAGRVIAIKSGTAQISGIDASACLGDKVQVSSKNGKLNGEIVSISQASATVLLDRGVVGVAVGDRAIVGLQEQFSPDSSWIGRVVDPAGTPLDGRPLLPGPVMKSLHAVPPAAHQRRGLGTRLETGLAVFNTVLPIVAGQRVGLFAGSGVGKSTLLGNFAKGVSADVVVVALVGERGRELQGFIKDVLGPEGMQRSVVIAATSDQSPQMRRDCALSAMTVAEYFRDLGLHVLLLVDSITRYCEAHRELSVAGGESANLRGYPASTGPAIAGLCERAGPGKAEQGDITAVFSVLVAGSDMEEPVADMLRGVLDGHVVLDREIAERGRFPAVNVLRSVSRSLPAAATVIENDLIMQLRNMIGKYDQAALMIQAGLYVSGHDLETDKAVSCNSAIEDFLSLTDGRGALAHFARLRQCLSNGAGLDN